MSEWIEWHGGECPVDGETKVLVKYFSDVESKSPRKASHFRWSYRDVSYGNIVAYKIANTSIDDATPEEWDEVAQKGYDDTQKGDVQSQIKKTCDNIKQLLLAKNEKYGNSALQPKRIFSKASTIEQLLVRIDDKLSRIETTGLQGADEDTLEDLIGYLILLKVAKNEK